jgi:hypothetical protein
MRERTARPAACEGPPATFNRLHEGPTTYGRRVGEISPTTLSRVFPALRPHRVARRPSQPCHGCFQQPWKPGPFRRKVLSMEEQIRVDSLLEAIRQRPACYLDERSLSSLWCWLQGYWLALSSHSVPIPPGVALPSDFSEWVAYRLGFFESTSGWRKMILRRVSDESAALDRFFELLNEHHTRKPRLVARVEGHSKEDRPPRILRDGVFREQEWSDVSRYSHFDRVYERSRVLRWV